MTLEYATPALLFPTLSLILLAYTNRFMSLAKLIRDLHATYLRKQDKNILDQIKNLQRRIILIRNMTATGILAIFLCVGCMFLIHKGLNELAMYVFNTVMVLMLISLGMCLVEIIISTEALTLELSDISEHIKEDPKIVSAFKHIKSALTLDHHKDEPGKPTSDSQTDQYDS